MVPALRAILVGRDYNRFQRNLDLLFATGLLVATFAAYAFGLFQVAGGVIVLPEDATLVGFVAAAGIGIRRGGLLVAWALLFAGYLGFRADWTLLGLSSHSFGGKLAFLFDPVGLGRSRGRCHRQRDIRLRHRVSIPVVYWSSPTG